MRVVASVGIGVLCAGLVSTSANAQAIPDAIRPHVYTVDWGWDGALILGSGAVWAVGQFALPSTLAPSCPCYGSNDVLPIDRVALHRNDAGIALASDIGIALAIAAPLAFDALDVSLSHGRVRDWGDDAMIMLESVALSGAVDQVFKLGVHRPRPLVYDRTAGDPALSAGDNYLSFYSAHTSTAFAAGMSFAFTFAQRHPRSAARFAVLGAAVSLGALEGSLRVLAGKHFPTDVIAGAVAGTLFGIGVPWLHTHLPAAMFAVGPSTGGWTATMALAW